MKDLIRKIAIAGTGVALIAGVAGAEIGNSNTGYDSENHASLEWENETEVEIDNDADLHNDVFAVLFTGMNEVEKNTGDAEIDTGDAEATVAIENKANTAVVQVDSCCKAGADFDIVNDTTGADSENKAWVEWENETKVEIDNDADVHNNVNLCVSTGANEAEKNTGDASISTGDASASISISNSVNMAEVKVE